jgi:phosphoribosylaminoimidazole carboxylase (NCAIR synthetase)
VRVGVLGGGQLAWMLAQAAQDLGITLWVQTPDPQDAAVSLSAGQVIAPLDDPLGLAQLMQKCDLITFENEFINWELLARSARPGVMFRPNLTSLAPLLDKYDQRCYVRDLGIPQPEFWLLSQGDPPPTLPLVVKARRHGYDGLGTRIIHTPAALTALWQEWAVPTLLAETYVPFEQELALVAARDCQGRFAGGSMPPPPSPMPSASNSNSIPAPYSPPWTIRACWRPNGFISEMAMSYLTKLPPAPTTPVTTPWMPASLPNFTSIYEPSPGNP